MSRPRSPQPTHNAEGSFSSCLEKVVFTFFLLLIAVVLVGVTSGSSPSSDCGVSERFPPQVRQWCDPIVQYARDNHLPPDLIAALIWHESGGSPSAYSRSGAVGLMQIMPNDGIAASFQCKGRPCFSDRPSIQELQDPHFNIRYGARMLAQLVQKYGGSYRDALKAYGPMDVGYSYADTILAVYKQYGH